MLEPSQMKFKDGIFVFLKGILLGLLSLGIPGVSASTVGLVVGIYFVMVDAIANILKDFKNNIKFLLVLGLGYSLGAVGAAFSVTILFKNFPLVVACVIIGMILGSIVESAYKLRNDYKKLSHWIVFFAVFIFLGVYNFIISKGGTLTFPDKPTVGNLVSMGLIGFFTSTTFIIPGIDFAVVFLSLGIYYPFMNMITEIFSFGMDNYLSTLVVNLEILGVYLIGYGLGVFLFSKLIKKLADKYDKEMQFASFAFVVAAPAVFLMNCLSSDTFFVDVPQAIIGGILGVISLGLMLLFAFFAARKEIREKNAATALESEEKAEPAAE